MNTSSIQFIDTFDKKIAFYGGTFDPPHKGHQHVIEEVYRSTEYSQIICVPTSQNPLKKSHAIASDEDRLAMLNCIYQDYTYVTILDYEIKKGGISYTYDTLKYICSKFPLRNKANRFGLIIGADVSLEISCWIHLEKLRELVELIIIPRPHYEISLKNIHKLYSFTYRILECMALIDIEARVLRQDKKKLQKSVDVKVWDYIIEKNLYNINETK